MSLSKRIAKLESAADREGGLVVHLARVAPDGKTAEVNGQPHRLLPGESPPAFCRRVSAPRILVICESEADMHL
jgi:hypothetical protein